MEGLIPWPWNTLNMDVEDVEVRPGWSIHCRTRATWFSQPWNLWSDSSGSKWSKPFLVDKKAQNTSKSSNSWQMDVQMDVQWSSSQKSDFWCSKANYKPSRGLSGIKPSPNFVVAYGIGWIPRWKLSQEIYPKKTISNSTIVIPSGRYHRH